MTDTERQTQPMTLLGTENGWPNTDDPLTWAAEFSRAYQLEENPNAEWIASWFESAMIAGQGPDVMPPLEVDDRSYEQELRAQALAAARQATAGTLGSAPNVSPTELIKMARWVYDGREPWEPIVLHPDFESESETKNVWADGAGIVQVQDTELPGDDNG